jgi:hypothetical protein
MNARILLSTVLIAAGIAASVRAQGLLDQQLGPPTTPTPATSPATAPVTLRGNARPTTAPASKVQAPNPGTDIVSPNAAKTVDDDELLQQLLKPDTPPDPDAVKQRLLDMVVRMERASGLLNKKDPGEVTQETQRRIVSDLDIMIELARQQQQQSSSSSSQAQPAQPRQPGQPQDGSQKGEGGSTPATAEILPHGTYADPVTGELRNRDAANWGGLPPRDRDQVSHGANEEYLSSYKEMIDRYYQALSETNKPRNR